MTPARATTGLKHREREAEWLAAKAALLQAIDDLHHEAENDRNLEPALKRVRAANNTRHRAYRSWQASLRLVGQRFGELTVVELADRRNNGPLWLCRCDCGRTRVVREHKLRGSEITHCGDCHSPYRVYKSNLMGRRFGMLTVVAPAPREQRNERQGFWLCSCECGGTRTVRGYRLYDGGVTNCGCLPHTYVVDMAKGARFGNLTVIEQAGNNHQGKTLWLCRCDCGVTTVKLGRDMRNGKITACTECARKTGVEVMRTTRAARTAERRIETRDRTLAAGGRPCARCGAPLRSVRPVCQTCIAAARTKEREANAA